MKTKVFTVLMALCMIAMISNATTRDCPYAAQISQYQNISETTEGLSFPALPYVRNVEYRVYLGAGPWKPFIVSWRDANLQYHTENVWYPQTQLPIAWRKMYSTWSPCYNDPWLRVDPMPGYYYYPDTKFSTGLNYLVLDWECECWSMIAYVGSTGYPPLENYFYICE